MARRSSSIQPQDLNKAFAFHLASATSDFGFDSIVIPPPAVTFATHPFSSFFNSAVRIIMFQEEMLVLVSNQPSDPVQNERGCFSNSSIAAQTTVLGQPVIEPPGKTA